jgi:hypothetical protein
MARVVYGDASDFNTICFGMPDPATRKFLDEQWSNNRRFFIDNNFVNEVDSLMANYQSANTLTRARAILRSTDSLLTDPDRIYMLETLDDFQTATPAMQRWVMANPLARKLAQEQLIYGYAKTYHDIDPDGIGETHYDYRRAVDGLVKLYAKDNEDDYSHTEYLDSLLEEDRELTLDEKVDIRRTWENLEYFLNYTDQDPTNIYGGER